MSRILIDTHVFMRWIDEPSRIRGEWLDAIVSPDNEVFVSAVSGWEIETKKRIGKLQFDHVVLDVASELEFASLPVSMEQAVLAGALDWEHRDPFDRMLVAQAIEGDMVFVSADAIMKSAPGVRVL